MKSMMFAMLYQVAKFLIGSVDWTKIVSAVAAVVALLQADALALGGSLLNFAIEAAVQYLRRNDNGTTSA